MDWGLIVVALIGGGGLVGLLLYPATRRKADAEADKTAAEAWAILAENQSKQIAALYLRVEALEQEQVNKERRIDDLEAEIADLRTWIENQGLTPPPRRRK
jgi:hypothetical protein